MVIAAVIAFSGTQNSGAGEPLSATPSPVKAAPEHCPSVIAAVRFYSRRLNEWKVRMGAGSTLKPRRLTACPRYLAKTLRAKSYAAHKAYDRWLEHEYAWWKWLPDKFRRVGRCETGGTSGATSAGNWHWDSGTYVSAFGIIRAAFPTWNGHNSPREQYEVAASIQRRYGWSAWGCGNA